MKVFLSYAHRDRETARRLSALLHDAGLDVWDAEEHLEPGRNWHAAIAQALQDAEAMVVLLTPEALHSPSVQSEIDYALTAREYKHRLVPVLADDVGPESIPWILRKLHPIRLGGEPAATAREIAATLRRSAA